jgi:hypothetical protein
MLTVAKNVRSVRSELKLAILLRALSIALYLTGMGGAPVLNYAVVASSSVESPSSQPKRTVVASVRAVSRDKTVRLILAALIVRTPGTPGRLAPRRAVSVDNHEDTKWMLLPNTAVMNVPMRKSAFATPSPVPSIARFRVTQITVYAPSPAAPVVKPKLDPS